MNATSNKTRTWPVMFAFAGTMGVGLAAHAGDRSSTGDQKSRRRSL
jgi:hypothetical protein